MRKESDCQIKIYSRELRTNMTKEERRLWYDFLRKLPIKFHRQKPIGTYIVDFYCPAVKLVVELDGSQHYEEEGQNKDIERDSFLRSLGIIVLRYSNLELHRNFDGVCQDILNYVQAELRRE